MKKLHSGTMPFYNIRTKISEEKLRIQRMIDKMGVLFSPCRGSETAIVISGSPRSGTTWLMEILGTLPYYKTLFEPLHIKFFPEVKELNLPPKPYIPPTEKHPKLKEYLEKVFRGQVVSLHPHYRLGNPSEVWKRLWYYGVVAKFVRANRILPWIRENFEVKGIYLILRHPCATISSQLKYRIYGYFTMPDFPPKVVIINEALEIPEIAENPHMAMKIKNISSNIGLLALSWALDTYVPLKYLKTHPIEIVFYENLVLNPMQALETIFSSIGENIPKDALRKIKTPSMLAYDLKKEREEQLLKWKAHLTKRQVEEILEVISWFGIDFYDMSPEPDYEEVYTWQPPF